MNRKQYFAVSWFFLVLMFILMWLHTTFFLSTSTSLMTSTSNVNTYGIYYGVKWALISFMIYLSFPLFVLFQILGWLKKKNIEDEVPKEHKEVFKLARLEHEVKELKEKLKKEGKIKS